MAGSLLVSCLCLVAMAWLGPDAVGWRFAFAGIALFGIAIAWVIYCSGVDLAEDERGGEPRDRRRVDEVERP